MRSLFCMLPAAFLLSAPAFAEDFVLTVGGGYSPSGNQVSLEKNVLFFSRVLEETLQDGYRHTILFADGDDPRRDLQYLDLETPLPRAIDLLARVFNETDHQFERYRNHDIPDVADAAKTANLRDWFDSTGRTLTRDDRLLIYVTAHGGASEDKKRPRNTHLHLWDDDDITVEEFAKELNKLPEDLPVVVVMVQCYSGGFADLILERIDTPDQVTNHNRCGFFATTHDRVAAGCTPDIDEADYREYSSAFWAAIIGRSRVGEPIPSADYDQDGVVSFAEAHASVLIHSDTIDIPLKTSDAFLRNLSSEAPTSDALLARQAAQAATSQNSSDQGDEVIVALRPFQPLTADSDVATLVAVADPAERAAVEELSERLDLNRSDRAAEARDAAKRFEDERKRLRGQIGRLNRESRRARGDIKNAVLAEWPELAGQWNPEARRLVAEEPDSIVALIESHKQFQRWEELEIEASQLEEQRSDLERQWVKCQRLLATLETVALAHNLPLVANGDTLLRYERLREAEAASLTPQKSE